MLHQIKPIMKDLPAKLALLQIGESGLWRGLRCWICLNSRDELVLVAGGIVSVQQGHSSIALPTELTGVGSTVDLIK